MLHSQNCERYRLHFPLKQFNITVVSSGHKTFPLLSCWDLCFLFNKLQGLSDVWFGEEQFPLWCPWQDLTLHAAIICVQLSHEHEMWKNSTVSFRSLSSSLSFFVLSLIAQCWTFGVISIERPLLWKVTTVRQTVSIYRYLKLLWLRADDDLDSLKWLCDFSPLCKLAWSQILFFCEAYFTSADVSCVFLFKSDWHFQAAVIDRAPALTAPCFVVI